MKREENMKFWKKKFLKFYFFQYLKNSYKIQTTFHQYQKLYSTPPSLGARTCKVSRKYSNAFLSYSAKTKRDGQTDRQTDGRGALQYISRPGPAAPREIIITLYLGKMSSDIILLYTSSHHITSKVFKIFHRCFGKLRCRDNIFYTTHSVICIFLQDWQDAINF